MVPRDDAVLRACRPLTQQPQNALERQPSTTVIRVDSGPGCLSFGPWPCYILTVITFIKSHHSPCASVVCSSIKWGSETTSSKHAREGLRGVRGKKDEDLTHGTQVPSKSWLLLVWLWSSIWGDNCPLEGGQMYGMRGTYSEAPCFHLF